MYVQCGSDIFWMALFRDCASSLLLIKEYWATFCASLVFVALGAFSAWPAPVIPKFRRSETNVNITDNGVSWMVSVNPIGFIFGSFVTRFTSDRLGRRVTILYSALPVAVGVVIVAFAQQAWMLCISVFLWSCGTSMVSTVIGIYLAEISDKNIRGSLSVCTRFAFNLGNLLVMSVGPFLTYETLNFVLLPLPFIYFAACWWMPETPYYLLKEGKVDRARKELARLRGLKDGTKLETELESLQAGVKNEMSHSSSYRELFTGGQYRRAIIVAAGIKFTQIMTGGTTIKHYLGVIMSEAQMKKEHEQTVFLVFSGISFVVSIISSVLVDRVGRRTLLICSYLGTALSLSVVGIYFFLLNVVQIDHEALAAYGVIPFIGIVLSNVISTFGFIALSVVIPAEIFPINVKAVAMTSLSIFGGVLGFTVGKGYQNVKDLLGHHSVFWIFACVAFSGAVFTYFVVPETKGKNLSEIQRELQGDAYNDTNLNGKVDLKDGTELEELKPKETTPEETI